MSTPIRTSKPDANLFSISANIVQFRAGTDTAETIGELAPGSVVRQVPDSPDEWDAWVKVCDGTTGIEFQGVNIRQGRENAVDCNARAHHCSFDGDYGIGGSKSGDQVITVKGGCSFLSFSGQIYSQGKEAHVVVGNWADQCFDESTDLDFTGLSHANGQPLTFILARCSRVKLPRDANVLRWDSLCYSAYWWAKRASVALGFFGGAK